MTIHDFSLDIETLSTAKDAVILSIGAVYLNNCERYGEDGEQVLFPDTFYRVITVQDQIDNGRSINYQTMKWWLQQPEHVRNATFEGLTLPPTIVQTLGSAIIDLTVWAEGLAKSEAKNIWVKGVGFDGAIIESIHCGPGKMSDTAPFTYRDWQEVRTLERMFDTTVNDHMKKMHPTDYDIMTHWSHHALYDAAYQGVFVADILGHGVE